MNIGILNTYESLDLKRPIIPPRSTLYQLEPIGIGTPLVESLTGYIARLSQSHSLLPGVLISRKIPSFIQKVFLAKSAEMGLRALFNRARALNGIGSMARDFVQAFELLTLRNDLHFLTLLTWAEILPIQGLFRTHRAWCSACYNEWYLSEQVVYEPLVWTINAVTLCPQHYQPLHLCCHHCDQQLPLLAWRSRPGYCSNCEGWLGITPPVSICNSDPLSQNELTWQAWVVESIGELVAATPRLSSPPQRENIAKSLSLAIDTVTEGNVAAFARLLGMPKNTVWMWHTGKALPQLDVLIKICYTFQISLLDLLTQQNITAKPYKVTTQKPPDQHRQTRASSKSFDSNKVQEALLAVLVSNEEPPPTMKEVAQRLKHDRRTISKHFPEVCRAISAKHLTYTKAARLKRIEQYCREVRQAALQLHKQGEYPTEARVSHLLTKPGCLRYKEVRSALDEARHQLNL
jgi:transcriptional regulator with XRE-family HTH domain